MAASDDGLVTATAKLREQTEQLCGAAVQLRANTELLLLRYGPQAPPAASVAAPPCEQNREADAALDALLSFQANNGGGRPGVLALDEIPAGTLRTTLEAAGVRDEATQQLLRSLGCGGDVGGAGKGGVRADLLLYHLRRRRNTKQLEDHVLRLKLHEVVARRLPSVLETCAPPLGADAASAGDDLSEGTHNLLAMSRVQLREALRGLEAEIEASLWEESQRLRRLEESRRADSLAPTSGKYQAVVTGKFGDLATFKGGLDAHIGLPNPNSWEAIEHEHVKSADSLDPFRSGNHGLETTPRDEYEFVVRPQRGKNYAGLNADDHGYPGRMPLELETLLLAAGSSLHAQDSDATATARIDIEAHVAQVLAGRHAAAVALIALTAGGMGHVASTLWVRFGFTKGWGDADSGARAVEGQSSKSASERLGAAEGQGASLPQVTEVSFAHVLEAVDALVGWGHNAVEALVVKQLRRLCKARLLREELVALRLYTGSLSRGFALPLPLSCPLSLARTHPPLARCACMCMRAH